MSKISPLQFRRKVLDYYRQHGRDFTWRATENPYFIFVSELMLQQTQTHRVVPKYEAFIKQFPTWKKLAVASVPEVLKAWQGLGYNRRALYTYRTAQLVVGEYGGKFPKESAEMTKLPGIGPNTAGAIRAFAYDLPSVYIETNIRRVFIHFFFGGKKSVHDKDILELVAKTLPQRNTRQWYQALMDYGVMLSSKGIINPNRRSRHYVKQSKFGGSDREIRGVVLKILLKKPETNSRLFKHLVPLSQDSERIAKILSIMAREGFIVRSKNGWELSS